MTRNGILANPIDKSAIETPEAERRAIYEQRWASGGTTFMGGVQRPDLQPGRPTTPRPSLFAARYGRW